MNQSEKLDKILEAFAIGKIRQKESAEDIIGYSVADFCKILKLEVAIGEEKILQSILLANEHIEYVVPGFKDAHRISNKGLDFLNKGGYLQLDIKNKEKEDENRLKLKQIKSTISTNQWTKIGILLSIIISVIALVISIISVVNKS